MIVKEYSYGGLKMINIKAFIFALKTTWIRKIYSKNSKWLIILENYLNKNLLVNCGLDYLKEVIQNMKNKFWVDVLVAFRLLRIKFDKEENICKTQPHFIMTKFILEEHPFIIMNGFRMEFGVTMIF